MGYLVYLDAKIIELDKIEINRLRIIKKSYL